MAKKDKVQMVDDDQIENVGIMSGFMDDIDEIMSEIEDEMKDKEGDSSDMAGIMSRRPDSPEILMNNLRGDYRSVDARREELADLVGYNNAAETPDDVLALLQPVLAQQGIGSLEGMQPAMPPEAAMMPPPSMPLDAPPSGGIASLPMDQGPMPPMAMAKGGEVKYFQEGGEAADASYAAYPPEIVAEAKRRVMELLAPDVQEDLPDLMARTRELTPQYAELLGTGDRETSRGQMMMDIAQAALNFAGNVGPSGQPLTGSFASRLAGAASQLPSQIGARAAEARKGEVQARLSALQQAQSERSYAQELGAERRKARADLLAEIAKQENVRPMTAQEMDDFGIPQGQRDLPWVINEKTNEPEIAGGRPPAPLVDMGGDTLEKAGAETASQMVSESFSDATRAVQDIRKIDDTIKLIEEGDVDTGFGAEFRQNIRKAISLFSDDPERIATLSDTELLNSALGREVFGAITELKIGARGLDTPAEREFLREVLAGRITLTKDTLLRMAAIRRKSAENQINKWNNILETGRATDILPTFRGFIPDTPIAVPAPVYAPSDGPGSDVSARVNELLGRG